MRLQITMVAGLLLAGCGSTGQTLTNSPEERCATLLLGLDRVIMDTRLDRIDHIIAVRRAGELKAEARAYQMMGDFGQCVHFAEQGFELL